MNTANKDNKINGSEALMRSLEAEGVTRIFGYPGGAIMPVYDKIMDFSDRIEHILTRHEQGAIHAAQGYARIKGEPGVVVVTSGPGATNVVTGVSDAMMDSTPLVVITGQVAAGMLGTDAFQETDVVCVMQPISKWATQVRRAEDIPKAVAKAFYIANSGRPGPVVLDITKDAQVGMTEWNGYEKCNFIRSYNPAPALDQDKVAEIATLINESERPMILTGHGVMISRGEKALMEVAEKGDIPVASTLLGLSTFPSGHSLYKGMLGMHGNIGPNVNTNRADLIIAIGMRFDDRITGDTSCYAKQAKIIHIDIDPSEFNKNIPVNVALQADARVALEALAPLIAKKERKEWNNSFKPMDEVERAKVIEREVYPKAARGKMNMGEVVAKVSEATGNKAILVTDVGQNQMFSVRYFKYSEPKSVISSGGLGTMGFGLPAAIGAKMAAPDRTVCLFLGDGGLQMTVQELGTIMQYGTDVKIICLNNNFLGNVRQWQALFFNGRFSQTPMLNPDFVMLANSYGIAAENVSSREQLDDAIRRMVEHKGSYLLNVNIDEEDMVFPMTVAGHPVDEILLNADEQLDLKTV